MTNKPLHGIVNGKIIELPEDPGVPNGQHVAVVVTPMPTLRTTWGEGLRRCAGALANEWSTDDDRILEAIHQQRKQDSRRELPE